MSLLKHLNERKRYRKSVPPSNLSQGIEKGQQWKFREMRNTNAVWKGISIQAKKSMGKGELCPPTCRAAYNQPEQLLKINMCLSILWLVT